MRVRLVVEVEKIDDYRYRVSAQCEGDRDVCALLEAKKESIAQLVVEEMRFAERFRKSLHHAYKPG